ncbi:MAG: M23 family metallopeptidase [Candidatus Eisenbacteria bacterium]
MLSWLDTNLTGRITIVVIPRASQNIRSYRIPVGLVYGALLLALFGTFVTGNAVLRTAELAHARENVVRLTDQNGELSGRIEEMQETLSGLSVDLAELTSFEERIRTVADLDPIDDDVRMVGVGGPAVGSRVHLLGLEEGGGEGLLAKEVRTDAETLCRQTRLLRESFAEVLDALSSRRDEIARVPSVLPVENACLTAGFGYRSDPFTGRPAMHSGIDLSSRHGEPIVATASGTVRFTGKNGDLGLTVEIDHGNGIVTRYGHTHRVFVRNGQEVVRGQVIAAVGSSGRSTNPHVHYEVRVNDRNVNPFRYVLAS